MDDPFILRSLLTAVAEYMLMLYVLKHGRFQKYLVATLLFFLAGYQLGEFIFLSAGSQFGLQFATFSTTLLPALGLILTERLLKKRYGGWMLLVVATAMAFFLLLDSTLVSGAKDCFCLVKYSSLVNAENPFFLFWGIYYTATMAFTMLILLINIFNKKYKKIRKVLVLVLIAYISFFPTSYVITILFGLEFGLLTSFMCSLAIGCAFILSYLSVNYKKLVKK